MCETSATKKPRIIARRRRVGPLESSNTSLPIGEADKSAERRIDLRVVTIRKNQEL